MTGGRSWGDFTGMFFRPDSIWNKKLPADVAIDPNSALVVAALADRGLSTRHPQLKDDGTRATFTGNSTFNHKDWTSPVFIPSDGNYTLQPVLVDRPYTVIPENAALREAFSKVPIPNDARPSGPWPTPTSGPNPGDNHMVIYQVEELIDPVSGAVLPGQRMWEFWKCRHIFDPDPVHSDNIQAVGTDPVLLDTPGWHAVYGAAMEHVSVDDGAHYDANSWKGSGLGWGAAATKIPLVGGLLMQHEALAAHAGTPGAIPHALRMHVLQGGNPGALQRRDGTNQMRFPGFGSGDGASAYTYSPCEGDNFTLPKDYPLTEPDNFMREVIRAIRDYGWIITDTAGATSITCEIRNMVENSRSTQPDIWLGPTGLGGPTDPDAVFRKNPSVLMRDKIPWDSLQLVDKSYRPNQPVKQRLIIGTEV